MRPYEDDLTVTVARAPSRVAIADPAVAAARATSARRVVINRVCIVHSPGSAAGVTGARPRHWPKRPARHRSRRAEAAAATSFQEADGRVTAAVRESGRGSDRTRRGPKRGCSHPDTGGDLAQGRAHAVPQPAGAVRTAMDSAELRRVRPLRAHRLDRGSDAPKLLIEATQPCRTCRRLSRRSDSRAATATHSPAAAPSISATGNELFVVSAAGAAATRSLFDCIGLWLASVRRSERFAGVDVAAAMRPAFVALALRRT